MQTDISTCIRQVYVEFDTPADVVVTDPHLREEVATEVRNRSDEEDMTTDQVMRRLLQLRKAGQLPRLRR